VDSLRIMKLVKQSVSRMHCAPHWKQQERERDVHECRTEANSGYEKLSNLGLISRILVYML
jgi:hypothetical protein